MAWTSPKTWTSAVITATEFNEQIRDNEIWIKAALASQGITSDSAINNLKNAIGFAWRVMRTADQSIADSSEETILYDTEAAGFDFTGFHSNSTNTGRATIPSGGGGYYMVGVQGVYAANATGRRRLFLHYNQQLSTGSGSVIAKDSRAGFTGETNALEARMFFGPVSAGDYFASSTFQTSGGALAWTQATDYAPIFWGFRVFATE